MYILVNAVQEEQEQIEELIAENGELKTEIQRLVNRFDEIDQLKNELAEIIAIQSISVKNE